MKSNIFKAAMGLVLACGTAQAAGPLPVVLVVHENRGLNPHIEYIARRLALDNFIAIAQNTLNDVLPFDIPQLPRIPTLP